MPSPSGTYRDAVARLAEAQKSSRGAAPYSRWVNRRLGRYLAAWAYGRGLTPNQVSSISGVFTFAGIAVIALVRPTWWSSIVVAGLLLAGYAFDSADGQLARLRGGGSPAGEWLDHVLDALKITTLHLAIAICWFRFYGLTHAAYLLIPLAYAVVSTVFFFALLLADLLRRIARVEAGGSSATTASVNPDEPAPILRSLIVLPNDYGVLALAMVLLAAHVVFGVVYALLLGANALFLLAGSVRWFREMGTLA
jgi:phosphatidylglycerophosphate synthase